MIDNLNLIKPLLEFNNPGDFYQVYVFLRKKDMTEKSNHQSVRTIKSYVIESIEQLEKRYSEIKGLCEFFKARAYIHVNKHNHNDVGLDMISTIVERIKSGNIDQTYVFDKVVGRMKSKSKRWIVDIDTHDERTVEFIRTAINLCRPVTDKILETIPTKSGVYLITFPFDMKKFTNEMTLYLNYIPDIQKTNPTLLCYPDSLKN